MLTYLLQFLRLTSSWNPGSNCKAIPGSNTWPRDFEWAALNHSLSGRLLKPPPPGAICHPNQPTFNIATCPSVQAGWLNSAWHSDNPVSVIENNWVNDTCLPIPTYPCSGKGYPIYVVNATCSKDVKMGVDFARKNNVRLIVKGTGHDYLGRSSAPNSLSIWTRDIQGISFHDGFKPKGCTNTIDANAITIGAGVPMLEIDEQAHLRNLTIVGGGAGTVGIGGFLTGGGHSALSSTYGLAADQVLEMEVVTPGGDILTINECQQTDLFWAMRGGGGSTFGIITSATIKAFPSSRFVTASAFLGTVLGTEAYWDVIASVLSQFPELDAQGISCYSFIAPNLMSSSFNITSPINAYYGTFMLPLLHPTNTSESLKEAINKVFTEATAAYPFQFFSSVTTQTYPDFWAWYSVNNGPLDAGHDQVLGSRLLDGISLTQNLTALKEAYKKATPKGSVTSVFLVGGRSVQNVVPRGGSNSVNSAWRKAFVHSLVGVRWAPFDRTGKEIQENLLTNTYVEALRKLAPNMGAYVNEADPNEPNFQQAFWGDNYPRLLDIKRNLDPWDVFWCTPCVGNERWKVVDDVLCRV